MRKIIFASLLIFGASGIATDIQHEALAVTPPWDSFSKCISEAAVVQVISKIHQYRGYAFRKLSASDVASPHSNATLEFLTGDTISTHTFTLSVRTTSATGWALAEDNYGNAFPFSPAIDSNAELSDSGKSIGNVDMLVCK